MQRCLLLQFEFRWVNNCGISCPETYTTIFDRVLDAENCLLETQRQTVGHGALLFTTKRISLYVPSTCEQWLDAIFQAPDPLIHVSLQITVRARCVPVKVAS
jgi:hypothetical protein